MAPASWSENPKPRSLKKRETQLDDLADDELLQVLVRVPRKTARIIRAVARRWNSIICSPIYAARLCSRSDDYALFLDLDDLEYRPMLLPSEADPAVLHECPSFDLSYLGDCHRSISSTSEDLVLLSYDKKSFVCNPFTKESVRLPPLYGPTHLSSIVCECECEGEGGHNSSSRRRYRVVKFDVRNSLSFHSVFVSETGRWNYFTTSEQNNNNWNFKRQFVYPVAYRGKLYWYNGKDCVVYDPFGPKDDDIFNVISGPQLQLEDHPRIWNPNFWLGVARNGSLTLSLLYFERRDPKLDWRFGSCLCYLIVWELEDCELGGGQWILKYKSRFHKPERFDTQDFKIRALHPTQDVVYFTMSGGIGFHDLSSKATDNFSKVLLPGNEEQYYGFFKLRSFLLARPWRPTPVCYHGHK